MTLFVNPQLILKDDSIPDDNITFPVRIFELLIILRDKVYTVNAIESYRD